MSSIKGLLKRWCLKDITWVIRVIRRRCRWKLYFSPSIQLLWWWMVFIFYLISIKGCYLVIFLYTQLDSFICNHLNKYNSYYTITWKKEALKDCLPRKTSEEKKRKENKFVPRFHHLSSKCNFCLDFYGSHRGTQAGPFKQCLTRALHVAIVWS